MPYIRIYIWQGNVVGAHGRDHLWRWKAVGKHVVVVSNGVVGVVVVVGVLCAVVDGSGDGSGGVR